MDRECQNVVLLKAANLIEEKGLAKFQRQDQNGCLCVHGAISTALGGTAMSTAFDQNEEEVAARLREYLITKGGHPDDDRQTGVKLERPSWKAAGMAPWNNAEDRTKEEVVQALRGAASAK